MKKFTNQSRIIIASTTLLILVACLAAAHYNLLPVTIWSQHSKPPVNVTAKPLDNINKPVQIIRTGSVEKSASFPIKSESTGQISEIYVTEGQQIKSGQPLLKIQTSSFPAINQSSDTPNAPVSQAAEVSPQAQSNYNNALKDFNHYQKLYEIGAISRKQLDAAAARLEEAKENLNNSPISTPIPSNIPSAVTMPDNSAGSITISAPIDGIVSGLTITPGSTVLAGQQVLTLGNGQAVEVIVSLNQNDLYLLHLGTPVNIAVSNQNILGQVSRIDPQIQENQVSAFIAHIKPINCPAGLLQAGMPVNIHLDTGIQTAVPAVPQESVFQDDQGRYFIYVAINGKAMRQQINIGETIGNFIEITSNLPQQCMVITNNNDINDGDPVNITQ